MNSAGYGSGPVHGIWGQSTASALLDYQKTKALEPTGQINLRTLAALGVNPGNMMPNSSSSGSGSGGGSSGGSGSNQ